ncbi:MAG TPA: c-type cytochrome [Thermoanaerobaculia bacterium]|jgi:mono/diheme cytochrome c family protein|nr:c-type cytochrome [Thermoanaerobaculia bacterium]
MKTFFKVVGVVVLAIVALAAIGVAYLSLRKPAQRPPTAEKIAPTPERVARGKYLVHNVTICFDCHSERTSAYALPFKPGREGVGGFVWDRKIGFPGTLAAANLTPDAETGLGKWTDGEILRAMREGVDREGNALFPIMPYSHYRAMSDEDAKSIVAYLRTLQPQRYEEPKKSLDVPLNFIEKFIPKPIAAPVAAPDRHDTLAYGKYLTTIAACGECHTPKDDKGNSVPGKEFAGGFEMHTPEFRVVTANITPHPSTFVGRATKEEFIARFRAFANYTDQTAPQAPKGKNTLMPWIAFSGMTDEDLGAIYAYLKTVPPVEHRVNSFPDAAQ